MTLQELAGIHFDKGQRITITAVPLTKKEKKIMGMRKVKIKLTPEQQIKNLTEEITRQGDIIACQNVELTVLNSHLDKAYKGKRELEVRLEGMVAEVKGARANVVSLERDVKRMSEELIRLTQQNTGFEGELRETHRVLMFEKKEVSLLKSERDTFSRLLKIIKATVNGMTLQGEDRVEMSEGGLNG